mmetsp:Transcript_1119/g.1883  ORF Transcript_1119/g.1883 Transcript_1119/m.1883 type:complete len:317 (+) Transcript_1119:506-1456(+)
MRLTPALSLRTLSLCSLDQWRKAVLGFTRDFILVFVFFFLASETPFAPFLGLSPSRASFLFLPPGEDTVDVPFPLFGLLFFELAFSDCLVEALRLELEVALGVLLFPLGVLTFLEGFAIIAACGSTTLCKGISKYFLKSSLMYHTILSEVESSPLRFSFTAASASCLRSMFPDTRPPSCSLSAPTTFSVPSAPAFATYWTRLGSSSAGKPSCACLRHRAASVLCCCCFFFFWLGWGTAAAGSFFCFFFFWLCCWPWAEAPVPPAVVPLGDPAPLLVLLPFAEVLLLLASLRFFGVLVLPGRPVGRLRGLRNLAISA